MSYESMIDIMNESTQLDFYDYAIDSISLTEGIDIKGKFETVKKSILKAIKFIRDKCVQLWNKIKKKLGIKKYNLYSKKFPPLTKEQQQQATERLQKALTTGDSSEVEGKKKLVFVKDGSITYHYLSPNINKLFIKQTEYMSDAKKLSDYISSNRMGKSGLYIKNKMGADLKDKYSKDKIDLEVISDKTNSGILNQSTYDGLIKCYEEADKALSQESDILNKFNKVCSDAESKINSIKAEEFVHEDNFNSFKSEASNLLGYIRGCFMNINAVVQSLSSYQIRLENVLEKMQSLIKTYNYNVNM